MVRDDRQDAEPSSSDQAPQDGGAWVAQEEAAALCGCSYDTIRRYRRLKKLPRSRRRADGTVEVPVADLVAAGLLDPLRAGGDVDVLAARSRAERDLVVTRQELAVTTARLEAEAARAARAEGEVAFLRRLLAAGGPR